MDAPPADNCAADKRITPSSIFGQRKIPSSSRFVPEHQLYPVGAFRPKNIDRSRERIRRHRLAHQCRQSLGAFRKSTGLVATITRTAPVGPITCHLSMLAAPLSRSLRPHRGRPEPSRRRSRPRSFAYRAQPGAAAFCVDGGRTEKTVPRPGLPERAAALQHAKAQPTTLAIPAVSQIIATAKVRAVGLRQKQMRRLLRSQRQSVPCPRRSTFAGDLHR
jgi:hypothetical protein